MKTCAENHSLCYRNLHLAVSLARYEFLLSRDKKTELNENLSTCAENQSLLQSLQTAALLARCKFCFQWTKKWNSNENL